MNYQRSETRSGVQILWGNMFRDGRKRPVRYHMLTKRRSELIGNGSYNIVTACCRTEELSLFLLYCKSKAGFVLSFKTRRLRTEVEVTALRRGTSFVVTETPFLSTFCLWVFFHMPTLLTSGLFPCSTSTVMFWKNNTRRINVSFQI